MADLPARAPFPLSRRITSFSELLASRGGAEIHYAIGGIPFRTANTASNPEVRQTAPMQKEQQDVEPEAGEQTLAGWWLRSQASWHEGAGAKYAEPRGEIRESSRFLESSNVDVWTQGEIKLLKRAATVSSTITRAVAAIPDSTVNAVVVGQVGFVRKYTNLDAGTTTFDLYTNGAVTFTHVIATETAWYAAGNDARVYSGPIGTAPTPTCWSLTSGSTSKATRLLWAKHRLWAINGNRVYVLDPAATGNPTTPTATASVYNHPSSAYEYTDICDGPGGVYIAGHGDGSSGLQKIGLDASDTAVPTVGGAVVTAVLPTDEKALRVASLASSMICIATNRGVRVAVANSSGEMVYGPLFMERTELATGTLPALVSGGRWWWLCWGDQAKAWRIDSSVEVEEGVFAYASDLESGTDSFSSIAVRGDRPVVVNAAGALAYRHATELCESGYLTGARIRYRTEEPKTFVFIGLNTTPLDGSILLTAMNENDSSIDLVTYSEQGAGNLPVAQFPQDQGAQRFLSVKLTLGRKSGSPTLGPLVRGLQVKALPATKPQRLYVLNLHCFDLEAWSSGARDGYDGFSRDRYLALKAIEDAGGVTLLQDFSYETPVSELVRIEEMKFVRATQPDATKHDGGWGGYLLVTLRTLA